MKINLMNIFILFNLSIINFSFLYCQDSLIESKNYQNDRLEERARIKSKKQQIHQLVENAVKHFKKVSIEQACYDFIYDPVWRKGELYIFVYDQNGTCLAQGDDTDLIWRNISRLKSIERLPLLKQMLRASHGSEIGYIWNHSYMVSYVKTVRKNGMKYVLGAGFFPQSQEYATKMLVKTAAAYFYTHGKANTFALISEPEGPFVKGDIYTFVYDYNGVCFAHGENPALIGQNMIDMTDESGKHVVTDLIKLAREKGKGWIEYYWLNSLKKNYVTRVIDPKTKKAYLIAAGYYPNESLDEVKTFVNKAISYLKSNGSKNAFSEFSNKVGQFIRGGLFIFAYDLKGKCLANGNTPALVGQNLIKRIDQHGKYYVKDIIDLANKYGKAIVNYYVRNAFTMAYVEKIDTPDGKFILGSEYVPDSKVKEVEGFVGKAIDYLNNHTMDRACEKFSSRVGGFLHGDLSIFVYDINGIRLANGLRKNQIWRNFIKSTDQNGKPVIEDIVTMAVNGGGWYEYKILNANRKVYIKPFELNNKLYAIGSGYFL